MDGKFLKQLYEEREEAERKKREKREKKANKPIRVGSRKNIGPQTPKQKGGKGKRVSFVSLSVFESGSENMGWSGDELEGWESEDDILSISSSSSILSTITLATPAPACSNIPHTPPSPTPRPSRTLFEASGCRPVQYGRGRPGPLHTPPGSVQAVSGLRRPVGRPGPLRSLPCSVIARAKDGSSYNIYVFGSWSPDGSARYGDMWVLSIPSSLNTGWSTITGAPPNYKAMACYMVGRGIKMLVCCVTRTNGYQGECDRTGIHVFDMTKLMWEKGSALQWWGIRVPKEIYDVIDGGPYGGAILLPENGMGNSDMEATFKDIIAKTKPTSRTTSANNTRPTLTQAAQAPASGGDTSNSTVKEVQREESRVGQLVGQFR
ncbi:hypothetical protein EV426DRAFT_684999 [Tirmania nivea]|nr:hypothetical protein EV426DRAFT_684999 [Tirmania nivea]